MKRSQIFLTLMVFTFAICSAFASKSVLAIQGYQLVVPPSGQPFCDDVRLCDGTGNTCMFNGAAVKDSNNIGTSCGEILRHP